jgi:NAD-dependent deacetylase
MSRIVFLTGAGVSVASGIRPFRGADGIWNEEDVEAWATKDALIRDPEGCFERHAALARVVRDAKPNEAHEAIVALERRLGPDRVTVITQNVDSLHARAGSKNVLEIHGSLARLRCSDDECKSPSVSVESDADQARLRVCDTCGAPRRFDIVLFDEMLPVAVERNARSAIRSAGFFIAVGTSGAVAPAAGYVREADYVGARTMLINLEPPVPPNPFFHEVITGRAEDILPSLVHSLARD